MRPMTRFLCVGILLCIGLRVSEVQPVYANSRLEPGNYQGFMELVADHLTMASESNNGGSHIFTVFIRWQMKNGLQLKVINEKEAVLTQKSPTLSFEVQHGSSNRATAGGLSCTWWDNMEGTGSFAAPNAVNNFAAGTFTLILFSGSEIAWPQVDGESYGNAPSCAEKWGTELAKTQKDVVKTMTEQISEISFHIDFDSSGPDKISGTISLPKWVGTFPIKGGQADRTVEKGVWSVYRVRSKEWKKWMQEQKQK